MSEAARERDRRMGERRQPRRSPTADESWFGAFGSAEDTQVSQYENSPEMKAKAGDSAAAPASSTSDSRLFSRQAERIVSAGQTAFDRIYRTFIGARAALGVALVLAQAITGLFGARPSLEAALISVAYGTLALVLWLLPRKTPVEPKALARVFGAPWLSTIGVDLLAFSALHMLAPGSSLNYVALLVLPVLMAGVLTPRPLALATSAAVALMLLAVAWFGGLQGSNLTQLLTQAALAGSGFFVITVLAGELAGRLAREELSARGNMEMARQQAALNRLVIEEMQDGILVVDRRGRVRAANPAARRLLAPTGMSRPAPFQLRGVEAWQGLVRTVEQAFAESSWPEAGRDVTLAFEPDAARTLRVRVRFTRHKAAQANEDFCVLFLEDVRNMQARSRQEKLAAMGRVSAGIAHEIRNPLAAIAQANALLAEDATDAAQRQLTRMVADNVDRLKRIVDDVMEVAPGAVQDIVAIDATAMVAAICSDWARSVGVKLGEQSVLRVELPPQPLGVAFDAEHLRRVLVNLLDNAHRHASGAPGAVVLRLDSRDDARAFLSVASDGTPITAEVERYLFEPFFSTRSRGTGLGLYICRELCERYGASIDYRARAAGDPHPNEFYVVMRRMPLADTEARLHLTS
ncbi:MAG: PAS domain-containing protein [Piscinibacter sp.]|uniref:sensor histidine kinase n=1 Tax=Piscinibacter sp. TaxID=1903157 RepID=UPI001B5EBCFA|nr:ATP-binding protein [Piscinibacter sp.]MBP5989569.1 PAS domain-containing protein [Piscinibacter sp.]MBP6029463.1 PAS domain-containing protein [Piscinibacter sp.]